jgi:fumarate reductase flavoprotein subunit
MKDELSRRDFIKAGSLTAGVLAATAGLAACAPDSSTGSPSAGGSDGMAAGDLGGSIAVMEPIPDSEIKETIDVDVVVIGGGIAGSVAAATVAEEGKSVAVLQKADVAFSNGIGAAAWNSKVAQEAGVEFDPWEAVSAWMREEENRSDLNLLKTWIYNSGPTMDWLIPLTNDVEGVGPVFGPGPGPAYDASNFTYSYPVVHMWLGQMQALAQWLLDYSEEKGSKVYYNTPGVQIIRDDSNTGRVSGVIAKNEADEYIRFNAADAVILAAGEYGNNPVLRAKYMPYAEGLAHAYPRPDLNKGDGHYMGMYVGGKMQLSPHCSAIHYDPPIAVPDVPGSGIPWLFVNKLGRRFCNEDVEYGQLWGQDMNQPDFTHYQIFDDNYRTDYLEMGEGMMRGMFLGTNPAEAVDAAVAAGNVYKGDTVAGLAEAAGLPVDALTATVDRYNVLCDAGYDDDFGKQAARLKPVRQAPFYAIARQPGVLCALAGIITNGNYQALDENDEVIEGLYVVGNCQGNFFGGVEYPLIIPGLSLGRAITTGRVAGLQAAGKPIATGRL